MTNPAPHGDDAREHWVSRLIKQELCDHENCRVVGNMRHECEDCGKVFYEVARYST